MAELSLRRNVYAARGDFGFGGFQAPTGSMSMPGGGGTLASILGAASSLLGPLLARSGNQAMPVQAGFAGPVVSAGRALLPALAGGAGAALAEGAMSLFGGGGGGDELFTASGVPRRTVPVRSPVNGRMYWIGNKGAPILFRGDLAAKRRVEDIARFAARGRSRRARRFRR